MSRFKLCKSQNPFFGEKCAQPLRQTRVPPMNVPIYLLIYRHHAVHPPPLSLRRLHCTVRDGEGTVATRASLHAHSSTLFPENPVAPSCLNRLRLMETSVMQLERPCAAWQGTTNGRSPEAPALWRIRRTGRFCLLQNLEIIVSCEEPIANISLYGIRTDIR